MKYLIVGTAGHVDHGKTALVQALTGMDTDRLKEEKERGISIELGFAFLALGDDVVAGIVDVPGHERFLKNMLAGTGSIDIAILVIAADEGVMPQTREHLMMLQLYGIRQGIVVINKVDKADNEWLELVEEEVRQTLGGTFLEAAPFCRVSALSGYGIEDLRQQLHSLAQAAAARDSAAPFRLWIDRVFSVKGHGVVVTGSVLSGKAAIGDTLQLVPDGVPVRVRGLETHGKKVPVVYAGQRAAINLGGIELTQVERGMAVSGMGYGQISETWDAKITWRQAVVSGTRVRLHIGTAEVLGRIHFFKGAPAVYARLLLEAPLAAGTGDYGILRLYSPPHLLGGVQLMAPAGRTRRLAKERQYWIDAVSSENREQMIFWYLQECARPMAKEQIMLRMGYRRAELFEQALRTLLDNKLVQQLECGLVSRQVLSELTAKALLWLDTYHASHPDEAGVAREILRQQLGIEDKVFEELADLWQREGKVNSNGAIIALAAHASSHSSWQQDLLARVDKALPEAWIGNVDPDVLAEKMGIAHDKAKMVFTALIREKRLLRVGDMYVYSKTMQYMIDALSRYFQQHGTITVAELRDLLATTRKVALPVLEYFDMNKYTIRDGDLRRPGLRLNNLSEKKNN